jgi:hypothetical protein
MKKKVSNSELAEQISGVVNARPSIDSKKDVAVSEPPVHIKHYRNEQQSIVRQSCIKSAVALLSGKVNDRTNIKPIAEEVIAVAEIFENWVSR